MRSYARCLLLASCAFNTLIALPIGNTGTFESQAGFWGNYVFNRHLTLTKSEREVPKTEIYTSGGLVSYAPIDRVQIDIGLGVTDIKFNTYLSSISLEDAGSENIFVETDASFSYSLGVRAKAFTFHNFTAGFEAEYFSARPRVHSLTNRVYDSIVYPNAHLKYQETQLGCALTYPLTISNFATFIPYAGVKFSHVHGTFSDILVSISGVDIPLSYIELKQDRSIGYAIGSTLFNGTIWNITAEGRFSDETAFSIMTNFIF